MYVYPLFVASLRDRYKFRNYFLKRDLRILDEDATSLINRDADRLSVSIYLLRTHLRQFKGNTHSQQRRRNHENNEQHEHHVDEGRDVDFGHQLVMPAAAPVAAAAPSAGISYRHAHGVFTPSGALRDLFIDLPRQYGGELVGEAFHPQSQLARVG